MVLGRHPGIVDTMSLCGYLVVLGRGGTQCVGNTRMMQQFRHRKFSCLPFPEDCRDKKPLDMNIEKKKESVDYNVLAMGQTHFL